MSLIAVASRYAKSLIELAQETGQLDEVVRDMQLFDEVVGHREFYLLLKSPIIKADKKIQIFNLLFADKMSELTNSFLNIVVRKGREELLTEMSREFLRQYKVLQNITTASITTARPISNATILEVKENVKSYSEIDGELELESLTDPEIIGGFILQIEDNLYDASIRNKLSGFKKEILDNSHIKSL